MSKKESKSNNKENYIKLKSPLFLSPNVPKKHNNIIKLNIEPKKIYQETEYNLSKNKIKKKINSGNLNINNSKLLLKKNKTQNISALNFIENNQQQNNILNNILKKNSGSAYELLNNINNIKNNYLQNSNEKSKNIIKLNNINPIEFIYTSRNDKNNKNNEQIHPKIIFLKKEKNNNSKENIIKEEEKKENINCLLRNNFSNVKIYPTTFLNNKIIFQNVDNNNIDNNNINTIKKNNSKIKKEKIIIDSTEKPKEKNEKFQSIEDLHFFIIDTLQKGKIFAQDLIKN